MKFSGKSNFILKVTKNKASLSLSLSLENANLEKVTTAVKILSKKNTFRNVRVSGFGYRAKLKTRKPRKFTFFPLKTYLDL